jgi:predicted nucleic-acid-binding Zn-ribbon protein
MIRTKNYRLVRINMGEKEAKKCPKCGSDITDKRNVRLPSSVEILSPLEAAAYVCNKCGHIELYRR